MFFELECFNIELKEEYYNIIEKTLKQCYKEEKINSKKLYIEVILTDNQYIRECNKKYRGIDKETDVLSFPMFERSDFPIKVGKFPEILGNIVVSIPKIKDQAFEYGNTFERELSYMIIHSFYHLMGYDHEKEDDKKEMRGKEENIIKKLFNT